jgi:nickel/cobalt exporter
MEAESLGALIAMAFGMGLVHALDADHVMAVTTLASHRPRLGRSLAYSARWAAGHAFSLAMVLLLWLGLGFSLPAWVAELAEWFVVALLVGMGVALLATLRRQSLRLVFHQHPGLPAHAHWHSDGTTARADSHRHGAVLIGALHGLAGSAPLLALIPAVAHGQAGWALAHLGIFSLGMLLAMLLCGGVLGGLTAGLASRGFRLGVFALRGAIGLGAIGIGIDLGLRLLQAS